MGASRLKRAKQNSIKIKWRERTMKIYNSEWLSLSKEIKLKLIRLAILENPAKFTSHLITASEKGA